jgi:hypothetical protein
LISCIIHFLGDGRNSSSSLVWLNYLLSWMHYIICSSPYPVLLRCELWISGIFYDAK